MRIWRVPYPKFGKGPALERTGAIASRLGVDLAGFGRQGAVVVGSNGKGSTAAMTAALLQETGASVGLFTSPHLFELNERFRLDGEDISDEELGHHWSRVAAAADTARMSQDLGGFEFLFLIAADWFAARGCAHTVWEAGIGGRLDPARLVEARRVALASLDLEHTELLGRTLEDIAREKIDAAPSGALLFVSERCENQRAVIEAHAAARGVDVRFVPDALLGSLTPPLAGAHQRGNAALAVALAQNVTQQNEAALARGLSSTRWPGRLETLNQAPLVVIDVGHTPAGVIAAREGFEAMRDGRQGVLVCGVSADKDARAIVSALAPGFSAIICAAARHKGTSPAIIAAHAQEANPEAEIALAECVADARHMALQRAGASGAVYVAGGLFLAAEFRAADHGRDPAGLLFF